MKIWSVKETDMKRVFCKLFFPSMKIVIIIRDKVTPGNWDSSSSNDQPMTKVSTRYNNDSFIQSRCGNVNV